MRPYLLLIATLLTCVQTAYADEHELQITGAWIREAPPTQNVMAGYMRIKNLSDVPRRITGASSAAFRSIEMHRTVMKDGMARMEEQPALLIPATGTAVLEPGGLHLMLIDPQRPVRAGDLIQIELHIEPDLTQTLTAEVRRDDSGGQDHTHHHHH